MGARVQVQRLRAVRRRAGRACGRRQKGCLSHRGSPKRRLFMPAGAAPERGGRGPTPALAGSREHGRPGRSQAPEPWSFGRNIRLVSGDGRESRQAPEKAARTGKPPPTILGPVPRPSQVFRLLGRTLSGEGNCSCPYLFIVLARTHTHTHVRARARTHTHTHTGSGCPSRPCAGRSLRRARGRRAWYLAPVCACVCVCVCVCACLVLGAGGAERLLVDARAGGGEGAAAKDAAEIADSERRHRHRKRFTQTHRHTDIRVNLQTTGRQDGKRACMQAD